MNNKNNGNPIVAIIMMIVIVFLLIISFNLDTVKNYFNKKDSVVENNNDNNNEKTSDNDNNNNNNDNKGNNDKDKNNKVGRVTITFALRGYKEEVIVVGTKWNDPGFTATGSDGKDYRNKVIVSGTVNYNVVGTYKINYSLNVGTINKTLTRTVKVVNKNIPVSSISTNKNDYSIYLNEQVSLKVTINPSNATNKNLSYESSNPSIATVDKNGRVTGVNVGTAIITITSKSNINVKTTCRIVVKKREETTKPPTTPTTVNQEEKIHFINIVAGDAILVESNGRYGLIDAGNPSNTGDSYFDIANGNGMTVLNYLNKKGVKHLEFIIGSHAHSDHIGGIPELISNSNLVDKNTTFIYKQISRDSSKYGEITISENYRFNDTDRDWKSTTFLDKAKTAVSNKGGTLLETSSHTSSSMSGLKASYVKNNDKWMDYITFQMEDLNFKIYNLYQYSETSGGKTYIDLNANSLVTIITSKNGKKVWLSGDLNVRSDYEKYYADRIGKVDVLKANHHGNAMSNSYSLLSKTKPSHFIIPHSAGNAVAAITYVKSYGGKYYYSGISGNSAVVVTLGGTISVSSKANSPTITNNWGIWNLSGEKVYWTYVGNDGNFVKNDWVSYKGEWYYMDKDGYMSTSAWIKDNNKWYYLGADGKMYKSTTKVIDGKSYTFDGSGACTNGDGC